MKLSLRMLRWLLEDRRINHVFENLRNFLICGTLAYLSLHLIRVSGTGFIGSVDRALSSIVLLASLLLMLLNMLDGYVRIRNSLGHGISILLTTLYILLAVYIVLTMTTAKMQPSEVEPEGAAHIPFFIFK